MEYVKFFSVNDLSCAFYLEKVKKTIETFVSNKIYYNVNEVIELYNVKRFFDSGVFFSKCSKDEQERYNKIVELFPKSIGRYFSSIVGSNFASIFESVELEYLQDFWYLIEYYKTYKKFSSEDFIEVFKVPTFTINDIVKQQEIICHFGREIHEYILSDSQHAEIILDKYVVNSAEKSREIYFPSELTDGDKEELILKYIQSEDPNPNYLSLIPSIKSKPDFFISDTTKLEAKRKHEEYIKEFFENDQGIQLGVEVGFVDHQIDESVVIYKSGKLTASYSLDWIKDNLDFPTLMNNFIHLFNFTDMQMRSLFVNKEYFMGVLERMAGIKAQDQYKKGIVFEQNQTLYMLQMMLYRKILKDFHIRLEDVFQWFFDKYIYEEFGVKGFRISMPSEFSSDLEKCRTIATEIESVLKQFSLIAKHGNIDHELLEMSSKHLFYKEIISLLSIKYIYGKGNDYDRVTNYFFSDQCMLSYLSKVNKKYRSFFDLVNKEKISLNDYTLYQSDLNWMIDKGYLKLDYGIIKMRTKLVYLLKDLYENGVSCINHLKGYEEEIKWLEKENMIEYESTLFSRPEQDYLNFLMNNSFSNGLALRNKYVHGTQSIAKENHEKDYNIFLNVLALVIIKINDEFCLREEI